MLVIKGVIFDFDGTLLDTLSEWKNIGERYLISKGKSPEKNINEILRPMSLEEAGKYFIKNYDIRLTVEEIIAEIDELISDKYINHFQLKPYVKEYIDKLKKDNVKMCIATATISNLVYAALERLNVKEYFDFVLTCSEVGYSKRYPNIYIECGEKLGFDKKDIVVYEDTISCIETAKKAGFNVVGIYDQLSGLEEEAIKNASENYICSFSELL